MKNWPRAPKSHRACCNTLTHIWACFLHRSALHTNRHWRWQVKVPMKFTFFTGILFFHKWCLAPYRNSPSYHSIHQSRGDAFHEKRSAVYQWNTRVRRSNHSPLYVPRSISDLPPIHVIRSDADVVAGLLMSMEGEKSLFFSTISCFPLSRRDIVSKSPTRWTKQLARYRNDTAAIDWRSQFRCSSLIHWNIIPSFENRWIPPDLRS